MEQQQSSRGGRRPGSGRPANDRSVALMVRITPEADAILKQQPNKSEFIDRIIKEHKI